MDIGQAVIQVGPHTVQAQIFILANLAIALGYLCVPWLVLPHIDLRRRTLVAGGVFFVGCTGSHLEMVFDVMFRHSRHLPIGWGTTVWHIAQAFGTWAFIMFFRAELKRAREMIAHVANASQRAESAVGRIPPGDLHDELAVTVAALRVAHGHPPIDPVKDKTDQAIEKLPAKGEWIKAAPGVFMICGTLVVISILAVYATLVVTGSPTDAFFRLVNLFLNALGTLVTMATLSVGLVHARRTLENRRIALKGQQEAHRAADAATAAAKGVNGELSKRIMEAAGRAAADAARQLQRERDEAAAALRAERGNAAQDRRAYEGDRDRYEGDRRDYEASRGGYEADRAAYQAGQPDARQETEDGNTEGS
jgi:hypothetical protein